ncbi:dihydroxyacetone kinase subunit L [Clostridium algidicarnis]|uniref:dihydroxyacetone kinase subunit DhaL n=1 Tax=Clostridium algidicarnis TaxID=37659 RepID=UPI001C0DE67E|nr:dihydroxyacetone kinase subunit DhaL [Clostridium algidicarnis]MBU3210582.1 dihydroxyacetone kinase subunit L [Clostridium algidicarnis]
MSLKGVEIKELLIKLSEVMTKNKEYLTELDATIGDGDHGLNLHKGFTAMVDKIKDDTGEDIGDMLKKSGLALLSSVGGASGPLYGTAFMKASMKVQGKSEIDLKDFLEMLQAALDGVKLRGKAEIDDKTMVDAIEPALNQLRESLANYESPIDTLFKVKEAAYKGANHTMDIIAKKGRASYLGDRSLGHKDPGAVSSSLIFETIYDFVKSKG